MAEAPHEELLLGLRSDLNLPNFDLSAFDPSSALEVANWGERLVHSFLQQLQQQEGADVVAVKWMNETDESGAPYDFRVTMCDPQNRETVDVFVEVKSTCTKSKAFFEISDRQYEFAQQQQHNFHLYRVFSAGDPSQVRVIKLVNVAKLLQEKHLKLCMVV